MEPIKLEFIVKGDIDNELAKIKLAIKGVGDESYTSFKRLLNSSNESFNGLSRVAQGQAVVLQRVIQELRQNEAAQEALFDKFEKGNISAANYAQAQARLSVQQAELKRQASDLNQELQREIQLNGKVADSLEQKISHLSNLKAEYSKLSQEERDNELVGGRLISQVKVLSKEIEDINNRFRTEKAQITFVSGSLQEKTALIAKLRNEYARLTPAERDSEQIGGKLVTQIKTLNKEVEDINNRFRIEKVVVSQISGSLQEKNTILSKLREEYARLNKEERENEKIGGQLITRIRELNREVKNINEGMEDTKTESGDLTDALEMIPGAIGGSISKFKQLLSIGKSFMSSGLGIFIGGLASAFFVLKTGIEGSEEATVRLSAKTEYFKSIYSTQKKMLTESMAAFYNLITGDTEAMNENLKAFTRLQLHQVGYAQLSQKAVIERNNVNKQEERNNGLILANAAAIEQYRTGLMDVNKTFEERKKLGQDILKLEKENSQLKLDVISEKYKVFLDASSEAIERISDKFPEQIKLAQEYFKTLTTGGELTLTQQQQLINAIHDITSGLDKSWDDKQKAEFRSYFTDALSATKDYYSKSREVSTNLSNIIKQQANEAAKANKKTALQKLQEEVKLYKEQYAILYAYERNMGKEAADEAFKDLRTQGTDFIAYLSNKINELKSKTTRTKEEDINLGWLEKTRLEVAPKFDASAFKNSIEEKKKLYKKDIDAYIEYLEKLRKLMDQDTSTAGTQKRIILDLEIKEQKEERQKQIDDTLKQYAGYTTQMTSLHTTYQRDMSRLNTLLTKATTDEERKRIQETIKLREDGYKQSLLNLGIENEDFYNVLFGGLQEVSIKTLRKALEDAEKWIKEFEEKTKVDPNSKTGIDLSNIKSQLKGIGNDMDKVSSVTAKAPMDFSKGVGTWATQFQDAAAKTLENLEQIADVAHYIDEDFGNAMDTVVGIVGGVSDIAEGVMSVFKGDIVSAVNKSITGTYKIFKTLADNVKYNRQVRRDYEEGLLETYDKELEYNSILRERLRVQQQIGETSLKYFTRLQEELNKQKVSANAEYNEVWSKLMGEQYISQTNYRHGTWFRKAKTWNDYESLSGKTYEEIEKLYTQDKLEGAAKTLFERLKQLKNEGADVVDMMDDLKTEMDEAYTGTTTSAISDSIIQGFINGKKGAVDFADDFRELMRDAMLKSIKMKYLEAPLQKWYEQFAKDSESGLTEDKISKLREQYNAIINDAAKHAEEMEKITGVTIADPDSSNENSLKGALAKASQESIDLLAGQTGALRVTADNSYYKLTSLYTLQERGWNEVTEIKKSVALIEGHARRTSDAVDHMSTIGVKINMNMN